MKPDSIAPETAGNVSWDVLVVGAGPAGSIAGHRLTQLGHRVLLVDRDHFPREKVCGGCISRASVELLVRAGMWPSLAALGPSPLESVEIRANGHRAQLRLPGGMALTRSALDDSLVQQAVDGGATLLDATRVLRVVPEADKCQVIVRHEHHQYELLAKIVIVANGLGGRLLTDHLPRAVPTDSRIGAGVTVSGSQASFRPGTIHMHCGRHGYVGVVIAEAEQLVMAAALDTGYVQEMGSLGSAVKQVLAEAGAAVISDVEHWPWRGTPYLTHQPARLASDRVFLVGDAAGYVEPFTGEGMYWAMLSALAVTPLVDSAVGRWNPELSRRWECTYRELLQGRKKLCRAIARGLRSPWLTRAAVTTLSRFPQLAAPIVHRVADGVCLP